jgi:hypothetical protein
VVSCSDSSARGIDAPGDFVETGGSTAHSGPVPTRNSSAAKSLRISRRRGMPSRAMTGHPQKPRRSPSGRFVLQDPGISGPGEPRSAPSGRRPEAHRGQPQAEARHCRSRPVPPCHGCSMAGSRPWRSFSQPSWPGGTGHRVQALVDAQEPGGQAWATDARPRHPRFDSQDVASQPNLGQPASAQRTG